MSPPPTKIPILAVIGSGVGDAARKVEPSCSRNSEPTRDADTRDRDRAAVEHAAGKCRDLDDRDAVEAERGAVSRPLLMIPPEKVETPATEMPTASAVIVPLLAMPPVNVSTPAMAMPSVAEIDPVLLTPPTNVPIGPQPHSVPMAMPTAPAVIVPPLKTPPENCVTPLIPMPMPANGSAAAIDPVLEIPPEKFRHC